MQLGAGYRAALMPNARWRRRQLRYERTKKRQLQARPQLAQVGALKRQNVEGVELHLVVIPARMQAVEIGNAVDAKQDRLAINDERG